MKRFALISAAIIFAALLAITLIRPTLWWLWLIFGPLILLVAHDVLQSRHTILRNYPVAGHFRYFFEDFRTHVRQYFITGDNEGVPFVREQRSLVYQRAKGEIDSHPFGTIQDVYADGQEWFNHSITALELGDVDRRVLVGNHQCAQPYSASVFNISAMSFGSLSANAVRALNGGAAKGNFYHNTGEGGASRHHLEPGGDLVWQIGTGYFGCRADDGGFDSARFTQTVAAPSIKMVELKLSQGAKPGGGGLLPGIKVTQEIAAARGVPVGQTVHSPASHSAFSTPIGLLEFLGRLRQLSDGKPVGFKLCIGQRQQFLAILKAIAATDIVPDFITIDGSEGGTGAAGQELTDHMGTPLRDGLVFARNALVGAGLKDQIRLIASGKIIHGFDIAAKLAMGADLCNSARGFMFSLGCIQARVCNKNVCPTGITTLDPWLQHGLVVADKCLRVANYHRETIRHLNEVLGAAGLTDPAQLAPHLLNRRLSLTETTHYRELYDYLAPGSLLDGTASGSIMDDWNQVTAERF